MRYCVIITIIVKYYNVIKQNHILHDTELTLD